MLMALNAKKLGLTIGSFVATIHLVWLILVAIGSAQWFIDKVMGLHMMQMTVTIQPFDILKALLLLVVGFAAGYIFGWLFATIYNLVEKKLG